MASHGLIGGDVFGVHALRFFDQRLLDLRNGANADALELLLHAADGPEKIHGGGARLADEVADLIEVAFEVACGLGFGVLHRESDAHSCSHADGRRAAHHHVADHIGDLFVRLAGHVSFFGGQLRLVDEAYALVGPFEGLNHDVVVAVRSNPKLHLMRRAAISRHIRHRGAAADFAGCSYREDPRR